MGNAYDQEQRIRDAKAKIAQRKPVEDAAQTAEINLAAREQAIADQFTSDIDPKDSQSYRIAQAKARVAVKQRQEQRAYTEQASPEMRKKTEDVLKYITKTERQLPKGIRRIQPSHGWVKPEREQTAKGWILYDKITVDDVIDLSKQNLELYDIQLHGRITLDDFDTKGNLTRDRSD